MNVCIIVHYIKYIFDLECHVKLLWKTLIIRIGVLTAILFLNRKLYSQYFNDGILIHNKIKKLFIDVQSVF